jgi:hypothetical protein
MSMEEPHAHMTESRESISASSLTLPLQVLRQLFEYLRFIVNSVFFHRPESTLIFSRLQIVLFTQYALVIASRSPQ